MDSNFSTDPLPSAGSAATGASAASDAAGTEESSDACVDDAADADGDTKDSTNGNAADADKDADAENEAGAADACVGRVEMDGASVDAEAEDAADDIDDGRKLLASLFGVMPSSSSIAPPAPGSRVAAPF